MKISVVTAPTVRPVTAADLKDHLRIAWDNTDEDTVLDGFIRAATDIAEAYTNRAFVQRTYDYYLDRWPKGDYIELPRPPLQSVTTVEWTKWDQTTDTLDSGTEYEVDAVSEPGRVILEYDETWPTDELHPRYPIRIRYVAGYAVDSPSDYRANIPPMIKVAIKMIAGHLYNHRENSVAGVQVSEIPNGAESLLAQYRIWPI